MEQALHFGGDFLLLLGSVFLFLGALGILRLPDVYNRLQAGTKATTLGAVGLILGVGLLEPAWLPKMVVIGLFIMVGNPISSHALARAAHKNGIPLWEKSELDAYGEQPAQPQAEEREEGAAS